MIFKKPQLILSAFLLTIVASPAGRATSQSRSTAGRQDIQAVPLKWLLTDIGEKCGCYFTLENAWTDDGIPTIGDTLVPVKIASESPQKAMESLRSAVPHLTYEVDRKDSRIVHIRDGRLARESRYALDRRVGPLEFTGNVPSLLDALAARGLPVSNAPYSVGSLESHDLDTVVHVKGG